ncbi:MAG: hypothetical protein ACE5G8_01095 [Anaerolineae bacterium]
MSNNRLALFNDPACFETVGRYTWRLQGSTLHLQALDDSCAVGRRAQTFAGRTWELCPPQGEKNAAPGCPGQ